MTWRAAFDPQKGRKVFTQQRIQARLEPAPEHPVQWAQRLKRVFNIDIGACAQCQSPVRIIACIEDPAVIRQVLDHLASKETTDRQARPPPQIGLFDE